MSEEEISYTARNYDAVDEQIAEIAAREKVRTESLRQENLRKLAITATIFAAAAAVIIIAIGIAIWLATKEKITIKTIEVPTKIVEVPVQNGYVPHTHPSTQNSLPTDGSARTSINDSKGLERLETRVFNEGSVSDSQSETATSERTDETSTFDISESSESQKQLLSRQRADLGKTYNSGARVILTWEAHHDLDLFVREPSGTIISYSSKTSPTGGYLDIDENVRSSNTTVSPIETIGWEQSQLRSGNYQISVGLYRIDSRSPGGNIPFLISIVDDGQVREIRSEVSVAKATKDITSVSLL